jgi:hypothetical protein
MKTSFKPENGRKCIAVNPRVERAQLLAQHVWKHGHGKLLHVAAGPRSKNDAKRMLHRRRGCAHGVGTQRSFTIKSSAWAHKEADISNMYADFNTAVVKNLLNDIKHCRQETTIA